MITVLHKILVLIHFSFRNLTRDLIEVCGSPNLICAYPQVIYQKAEAHLQQVVTFLQELPDIPQLNQNGNYPLDTFFQSEVELNNSLILLIKEDAEFLRSVAKGEIPATEDTCQCLVDVNGQKVIMCEK